MQKLVTVEVEIEPQPNVYVYGGVLKKGMQSQGGSQHNDYQKYMSGYGGDYQRHDGLESIEHSIGAEKADDREELIKRTREVLGKYCAPVHRSAKRGRSPLPIGRQHHFNMNAMTALNQLSTQLGQRRQMTVKS